MIEVEEIEKIDSVYNELISLYIPPTETLEDVMEFISHRIDDVGDINNKTYRANILRALALIHNILDTSKIQENGAVIFSGVVNSEKGIEKLKNFSYFDLKKPIEEFYYLRSDRFDVERLKNVF